jgi:hypothetical protein
MSELFEARIGFMEWEACPQCDYLEEDGSCPMNELDLIVQGDVLACNLYIKKREEKNE